MPKISVKRLVVGELAVNCYLVENTETRECFIVWMLQGIARFVRYF